MYGGATNNNNTTVTLSTSVPTGTYYLGIIADNQNYVRETDETNNTVVGTVVIHVSRDIDLAMDSFSTTATDVSRGSLISTTTIVSNLGTSTTPYTTAKLYLSTDDVITSSDIYAGLISVPALAGGDSTTINRSGYISYSVTPGTYYIGAIVDYLDTLEERSETNNTALGPIITVK